MADEIEPHDTMTELLIRPHLGLGDAIICNAIFRHYCKDHDVVVLCKRHNEHSVSFMLRDVKNCEVFSLPVRFDTPADQADAEANTFVQECQQIGKKVLCLGFFGPPPFRLESWDKDFYAQAGVDFEQSWSGFKIAQQPSIEIPPPSKEYIFVHEDVERGCVIRPELLPKKIKIVKPDRRKSNNFFAWWTIMAKAKEIHAMESSFACFADRLPEWAAERFVLHKYCRPSTPPQYRQKWEVIE